MKFQARLECDTSEFIIDIPFDNLKREEVDFNIRQNELASLKVVYNPCVDDRQCSDSSSCEKDT